jgi:hypothetical protein
MSFRRTTLPVGVLLATAAVLGAGQTAWAAEPGPNDHGAGHAPEHAGSEHRVGPLGPSSPGDPTAAPEYFFQHFDTYHFGHALVGFDVAAVAFPAWFEYHFVPTGQETFSRGVAPTSPPRVEGDTWVPTAAPQYQDGSEHSTSHKEGRPLYAPSDLGAGPDYLGKWVQGAPSAEEAVPALQESARRSLVPTEQSPPVIGDERVDYRPAPDAPKPPALAPAGVNDAVQQGWASGPGAAAATAVAPLTGGGSSQSSLNGGGHQ